MLAQVVDLARQGGLDRMLHAGIQEVSRLGAIEITIEVGRIVENLRIMVRRGTPFDERHQRRYPLASPHNLIFSPFQLLA